MTKKQTGRHVVTQPARSIFALVADFIYPPFCLLCDSRLQPMENHVCASCWESLPRIHEPMVEAEILGLEPPLHFHRSFAVLEYSDAVQKLMHFMKYQGTSGLARRMGEVLAQACEEESATQNIDMLTPVPLHPTRLRERGYNQAELLATRISEVQAIEVVPALRRVRYTSQQAKYTREKRMLNVKDAFCITKGVDLHGKNIALVDDVLTTGSTMNECAGQLVNAGAEYVLALTVVRI